jgi:hypothetical protein
MPLCETGGHLTDYSLLYKIVADGCVTSGDTAQGMTYYARSQGDVHKICFRRARDLLQVCIARTRDQLGRPVLLETRWMLACTCLLTITHGRHGTSLGATRI